jgi:hypothetical protein
MKLLPFLFVLTFGLNSVNANATEDFFFEAGLGVEYGGLGAQFHLPFDFNKIETFVSAGLFSASSQTGEEVGAGVGVNYFLDKTNSFSIYYGVVNIDKYLTDTLEVKAKADYGASIGYKYFFNGKNKSGFSVGVSYNVYEDENYPFISVGYRF